MCAVSLTFCFNSVKMLIRVLIFSTLVLAVNLVAGIFAKDQANQDFSPKNEHNFYTEGETPILSTLLRGSTRYTESFGTQRDSANLIKKPKITKRFAKEDERTQGDDENNLTRLYGRRRSLLRDEMQRTESQKSIAGVPRRYQRLKSADRSKDSLQAEESAHGLSVRTPDTVSAAGLSRSPPESTSSDNEHLGHENKTVKENDNIISTLETRENETGTKNETGSGVVTAGVGQSELSAQPPKTSVTAAVAESQTLSSSLRKRRLSTAMRPETQASPLPIAAALTMSESLYNHFHPLDEEVPEDHRLPFLNFGKKLVPVSTKTTSPVASSSSTRSTDSFEAVSTPPVGQYNLLSTTPQRVVTANAPSVHIPREDEVNEDMDVSVMKSVVEKNKATRSRGNSPQSLRKLGGLYRKQETSTSDIAANESPVSAAHAVSTEKSAPKAEQRASNSSEYDKNIRKKLGSLLNASTTDSTEVLPISKGTQRKSVPDNRSATDRPNTSVNVNPEVTSYLLLRHKYRSENAQSSEISKPKAASPTSRSAIPTQLSASSTRIEATVSTPFQRGRPSLPTRNIVSYVLPSRRPPHSYRQSSALSKSSKPPESVTKSSNISVYSENDTSPQKETNLTNISVATNSKEKSTVSSSPISLQTNPVFHNNLTGWKDFVDTATSGDEIDGYVSGLMNSEEKLIADAKELNTNREPLTKSNASLFEDTVNNSGRNITSESPIESVTIKLITSTSPPSGDTNVTIPTEVSSITTPIQSPTTKILSTAVVTSVSVKGAWPIMVTDTPALEQTLVPPQIFESQNAKIERLESVEQPERYAKNRTQSQVNESIASEIHHVSISADRSLSREFAGNTSSTSTDTSKEASDTSSGGNSTVTSVNREANGTTGTQNFTTAIKYITSNITEIPNIDTENGRGKSTTISINKINIDQTSESNETVLETVTVGIMKDAKTTRNPDATLKDSRSRGVAYPVTPEPPSPKPAARSSRKRNGTQPEDSARGENVFSSGTLSAPNAVTIVPPATATDAEFDFPLLKLYNASTSWSVSTRGVTKSPGEESKPTSEYPSKAGDNITEATTLTGGMADEVTEAKESVNTIGDISEGESGKVAAGKDGEEGIRPSIEADLTNSSTFVSNGGVNPVLGVGNVISGNNATTGSPRPGESVATTQGVSIAVYVLSALGVVPLTIGIALTARYCVRRRRKLLDDTDAYSDISSRRGARNGGQTGSDVGSPVAGTKLPRVQTHLSWDQEKSTSTVIPVSTTSWEFPRPKLRLQTVLGQGNFGQVLKAEADDISGHEGTTRLVAVKTVKEGASSQEKEDLLRELEIMQQLGCHANVVTLLGCCTEKEPYLLIMEYVMYGKLLAFLRDHRTRQHYYNFSEDSDALTSRDLTVFAYCVARGMEYLGSKGIIHRDLAARNVLVDHNKMCKIADFGMSRSVREMGDTYEQQHTKGALPIRWMAPESLHYRVFTHKSDVWSFGILMWEIVTLGSTPYPTMGAREVMRHVRDGYRLERPSHCRIELFRVISRCWNADPNKRPDFASLRHEIGALIEASKDGGGYVDLESFAESNKYNYSRSEEQSSHHYHHQHHHHHHHVHHPGFAPDALGGRITGDEEILNM